LIVVAGELSLEPKTAVSFLKTGHLALLATGFAPFPW